MAQRPPLRPVPSSASPALQGPSPSRSSPFACCRPSAPLAPGLLVSALLVVAGCQPARTPEAQRMDQLELKIQQLEQRLNNQAAGHTNGADRKGKPPAGAIKSLTIRTGSADDRLRIYWSDGSTTDLPCTKEQTTFACG